MQFSAVPCPNHEAQIELDNEIAHLGSNYSVIFEAIKQIRTLNKNDSAAHSKTQAIQTIKEIPEGDPSRKSFAFLELLLNATDSLYDSITSLIKEFNLRKNQIAKTISQASNIADELDFRDLNLEKAERKKILFYQL